jgi:Domain of unknown function (DUF4184)
VSGYRLRSFSSSPTLAATRSTSMSTSSRVHIEVDVLRLGYFLYLNAVGRFAHTLPGLFLVCLPVGWLSLWLFDRFGRRGAQRLLPSAWQLPAPPAGLYPLVATSCALLLGAASHVGWDGFTHASGWAVRLVPSLMDVVTIGPFTLPWFRVLQHGSTLLGVGVVAVVSWRWIRRQPAISRGEVWRRAWGPGAVLVTAGLLNGARFLSYGFAQFVVAGAVAVTLTLGLGLVLLGLGRPVARS